MSVSEIWDLGRNVDVDYLRGRINIKMVERCVVSIGDCEMRSADIIVVAIRSCEVGGMPCSRPVGFLNLRASLRPAKTFCCRSTTFVPSSSSAYSTSASHPLFLSPGSAFTSVFNLCEAYVPPHSACLSREMPTCGKSVGRGI